MKITKTAAVALMVALGFSKAKDWDEEKLKDRLVQIPQRIAEGDVPEEHLAAYGDLRDLKGDASKIEFDQGGVKTPGSLKKTPAAAPAPQAPDISEMTKKELLALIEDRGLQIKVGKKATVEEIRLLVGKELKRTKPAAPKPSAKQPAAKPAKELRKRDTYGCAEGTISARVNAVMDSKGKTAQQIAEEAGVSLVEAQGRLYYGCEIGAFERTPILFRIKKAE